MREKKAEDKANLERDQKEHEQELREMKQKEQAEKARNDMIAAKKAYDDANELQKLQMKLAYEKRREEYDIWQHRKMMIERAAKLRMLEKRRAESGREAERLKIEMEQRLRDVKKRQADEAREAARRAQEEVEEAAEREREYRERTEDARIRAAVKAKVEKAILE